MRNVTVMATDMRRIIGVFVLASLSAFAMPQAYACTIFTICDGEMVLFGGNEDQTPNSSFLVVDKNGKYGAIYFATPWGKSPLVMQMGINETGLCYDVNSIPEEKLNPHRDGISQSEWAVPRLLKECSTVDEVLSKIFSYAWGSSISYQVHFADKSGDAAVIHPGKAGELTYTRKPKGKGYLISTNFNLQRLDAGNWSCRRYETADRMLSEMNAQGKESVESAASVLEATHLGRPYRTLYSAVYDLQKLRIFLYYDCNFSSPYEMDVKLELAKTERYRKTALKDLFEGR